MTATLERPTPSAGAEPPPPAPERRPLPRWAWALIVVGAWVLVWLFTKGQHTLQMPQREHTDVQQHLTGFRDSVLASRDSNPIVQLTYDLGRRSVDVVEWLQRLVAVPAFPRPVPEIGWLGVVAIATWVGLAAAGWRIALLVGASFVSFGLFGYWDDSMDLLIVTGVAVAIALIIGLPLAVYYGTARPAGVKVLTTILDLMQTMPTFVYLTPIVLFFGIGPSAAVVCTLIYAVPPIIRIAGYGIRNVSATTIEATDSSGQTRRQRLTKVQLPMARSTIVVGINQTTMAALSMATIAAFVDGPGLGKPVLASLVRNDVGSAFVPGALIVVMAVMLDRTTTAASEASEKAARGQVDLRLRRTVLAVAGVVALVAVWVSRQYLWAADFSDPGWGRTVADKVDSLFTWITDTFHGLTQALADAVTNGLLNPLQSLIAESPWWLVAVVVLAFAVVFGRATALLPTVVCLAGLRFLGLWHDAMVTLTMVLVATLLVMVLAVVFGVWMARRRAVDWVLRPFLDAGQTIPPFVYLIPVLALFGPSRFTAIVAGIVYAAPVAIKLVADGIRGVSVTTLEASRSTGSTTWQEITKVQLPMARGSLVLAANQGLLYVLSMVVIGGMVGAGALGYDIVLGASRSEEWGKGAAAGISIVLLGIMLDRIMRASAVEDTVARNPPQRARRFPRFPGF